MQRWKMKRNPTTVPQSLKNINLGLLLRRYDIYNKQKQYIATKNAALPLARKAIQDKKHNIVIPEPTPQRHEQFTNEQVLAYWEKQVHIVEIIEARFEKKIEQYVKNIEKNFLSHLDTEVQSRQKFIKFVQKDWFEDNADDLLVQAQLDFVPLLDSVAVTAGNNANKLLGLSTPYLAFNYHDQIVKNVAKFTESMLDTDRLKLVDIISNGIQNGNSIPEIRGMITEAFDSISKTQAQLISRTEVMRTSNQAAKDAWEQSGVVDAYQWLTAGAIDECADYEGEVRAANDTNGFYDVANDFQDGDPPLHPNCKCVLIPIVVGTKAYVSDNTNLYDRIVELETQVDKRTKEFRELKDLQADNQAYIKALENLIGEGDE